MADKLYASQWVKIKGPDGRTDKSLHTKHLIGMEDSEIELLFEMARNPASFKDMPYEASSLVVMVMDAKGIDRTFEILEKALDGRTMLHLVQKFIEQDRVTDAEELAKRVCDFAVRNRDYATLLLLGRKALGFFPNLLPYYVESILPLLKEYKYGEGGPANAVTCLAFLSPEIEMQVEKFMRESADAVADATKKWKEVHNARRRK